MWRLSFWAEERDLQANEPLDQFLLQQKSLASMHIVTMQCGVFLDFLTGVTTHHTTAEPNPTTA